MTSFTQFNAARHAYAIRRLLIISLLSMGPQSYRIKWMAALLHECLQRAGTSSLVPQMALMQITFQNSKSKTQKAHESNTPSASMFHAYYWNKATCSWNKILCLRTQDHKLSPLHDLPLMRWQTIGPTTWLLMPPGGFGEWGSLTTEDHQPTLRQVGKEKEQVVRLPVIIGTTIYLRVYFRHVEIDSVQSHVCNLMFAISCFAFLFPLPAFFPALLSCFAFWFCLLVLRSCFAFLSCVTFLLCFLDMLSCFVYLFCFPVSHKLLMDFRVNSRSVSTHHYWTFTETLSEPKGHHQDFGDTPRNSQWQLVDLTTFAMGCEVLLHTI